MKKLHMRWRSFMVVLTQVNMNPGFLRSAPSARSDDLKVGRPIRARLKQRQLAEIEDLYRHGHSARAIAEQFGIGKTTVLSVLKRRGVVVRPRGRG